MGAEARSARETATVATRAPSTLQCLAVLGAIRIALKVLRFGLTVKAIQWAERRARPGGTGDAAMAEVIERRVAMAAALFPGRALCLEQSLTLHVLLRRAGVPARLRMGVQAYPFGAHAWVELGGRPLNDIEEHVAFFRPLPDVLP